MVFFKALFYAPRKATTHFCRLLFQICTNYSFSSSIFSTFFIICLKLSSMLISCILFWYIMSTLLTKMLNYFLYFLQFSAISFIFWKIEHRVEYQKANLSCKNYSKKMLVGFWDQSLGISESFHAFLNY